MLLFLLACAGGKGDSAAPLEPTLTNVQAEIFTPSCAFSSCHASTSPTVLEEGLTYDAIVGKDSIDNPGHTLIVPGDAEGSYLYQKCQPTGDYIGGVMPEGLPDGLDAERLALLEAWITAGAKND